DVRPGVRVSVRFFDLGEVEESLSLDVDVVEEPFDVAVAHGDVRQSDINRRDDQHSVASIGRGDSCTLAVEGNVGGEDLDAARPRAGRVGMRALGDLDPLVGLIAGDELRARVDPGHDGAMEKRDRNGRAQERPTEGTHDHGRYVRSIARLWQTMPRTRSSEITACAEDCYSVPRAPKGRSIGTRRWYCAQHSY